MHLRLRKKKVGRRKARLQYKDLKTEDIRNDRKLSGKKKGGRRGCIRSEDGSMLTGSSNICQRCERYVKELFNNDRGDLPDMGHDIEGHDIEGHDITRGEIKNGVRKMKEGKAVGPDDVR